MLYCLLYGVLADMLLYVICMPFCAVQCFMLCNVVCPFLAAVCPWSVLIDRSAAYVCLCLTLVHCLMLVYCSSFTDEVSLSHSIPLSFN